MKAAIFDGENLTIKSVNKPRNNDSYPVPSSPGLLSTYDQSFPRLINI